MNGDNNRSKQMNRQRSEQWQISGELRDSLERFDAAYNSIDRCLRKRFNKDNAFPFGALVSEFDRSTRAGADCDYLRMVAELRNLITHQKTNPYQPIAVPTEPVIQALENILQRLTNPILVVPRFNRTVEILSLDDSLAEVLKLIALRDYSQFPVYAGEHFRGLLTENGITRWLAHHVSNKLSLIELSEISVKQVLPEEEKRPNWMFVSRATTVDAAKALFVAHGMLEALLISHSGNRKEKAIGIITRWDVLHEK